MIQFAMVVIAVSALRVAPDESLTTEPYLAEVARYLYRWHLDENDVTPEVHRGEFVFWIRSIERELDAGDRSRFVEITLPRVGVQVLVKKADYEIPELDLQVRNERYMITHVGRTAKIDTPPPAGVVEVRLDYVTMRDHLFRTRSLLRPPDDELLGQMRQAAREETRKYLAARGDPAPDDTNVIHLAPISPVVNEAWAFWENGRLLFRFHADVDLNEPALWDHRQLAVQLYDLDEQVVVSLDEVAGSNAYVTRDMVGRVLYNCVVLGRRVVLEADAESDATTVGVTEDDPAAD